MSELSLARCSRERPSSFSSTVGRAPLRLAASSSGRLPERARVHQHCPIAPAGEEIQNSSMSPSESSKSFTEVGAADATARVVTIGPILERGMNPRDNPTARR